MWTGRDGEGRGEGREGVKVREGRAKVMLRGKVSRREGRSCQGMSKVREGKIKSVGCCYFIFYCGGICDYVVK